MAPSTLTPLATNRPLSTKEISDQAKIFQWNPIIPMKAWLRTANTLNQEGKSYLLDGNFAQAYLLYMRYMTLLMEYLPSHPDTRTTDGRKALATINKSLPDIATHLEKIKPIIQDEYVAWLESRKEELRQKKESDQARSKTPSAYEERASRDPALSSGTRLLDAGDHQDLAVELAEREIQRREANKRAVRRDGIPQEEEQSRRTAGLWDDWTSKLASKQAEDEEVFRRQMESTRAELDGGREAGEGDLPQRRIRPPIISPRGSQYQYPSISKFEPFQYEAQQLLPSRRTPTPQPPRPPKEEIFYRHELGHSHTPMAYTPELPAKEPIYPERALPTPETSQELPTPPPKIKEAPPSPPKKPQRLTFRPAAYLESGEPIRSIFLPNQLRRKFLSIASENTKRGLEMCGILCGTAVNNALFVRCLLIPEQKCTSDTCETENEGSMLEYCMNEDLLVLGWIHTHPTQTCFMSSRDLHTQAGYQVMLPESIAIVCAPKFEPS
ncbi:hypothetical protein GGR54DRAFT_608816 [Hypoxylon sp. NC1633]|nr:hypothetical protein GGR54DRAFT_608816 [Hypoxylon sp. NC1633]